MPRQAEAAFVGNQENSSFRALSQVPHNLRFLRVGESNPGLYGYTKGQLIGQAFQQDSLLSFNGYQYATYYNLAGNVCVARRKLSLGQWLEIALPYTTTSDDGHNTISMGICAKDGTIHLSYDHHDVTLHYCRSIVGLATDPEAHKWSADSFGASTSELVIGSSYPATSVTYPRFISRPDGDLFFECRQGMSGNGDSYLRHYNGATHLWEEYGRYIQGRDVEKNAYINRLSYDVKGRLHVSWVWRDTPDAITNHDLSYAYSDDDGKTWRDTQNKEVAVTEFPWPSGNERGKCLGLPLTSLVINPVKVHRGLINQESHHTDSKGRVHLLNSWMLDTEADDTDWDRSRGKAVLKHIVRKENGTWEVNVVMKNGSPAVTKNANSTADRSQIVVDAFDNAFVVGCQAEVFAASAAADYKDWGLISDADIGRFSGEAQVDHTLLLSDGVLSFLFESKSGTRQIEVVDYLLDNPHTPNGNGLHAQYFSDKNFTTLISESDGIPVGVPRVAGTGSTRWSGSLETLYGERYKLNVNTTVSVSVYINGAKLTGSGGEFDLPVIAGHRSNIVIEAQTSSTDDISLSWSSSSSPRAVIPYSSLYSKEVKQDEQGNV